MADKYILIDEGETAPLRLVHTAFERRIGLPRGTLQVPVKRCLLLPGGKYNPKTCSRPKEAAKAAKRARGL